MNNDNKLINRINEEESNFIEDLKCISKIAISQTASDQLGEQFRQTVSALLPWSHYERLMRVENLQARKFQAEIESQKQIFLMQRGIK